MMYGENVDICLNINIHIFSIARKKHLALHVVIVVRRKNVQCSIM